MSLVADVLEGRWGGKLGMAGRSAVGSGKGRLTRFLVCACLP